MQTRESGRTIIETLAVLGIMAVMTVGAITIYSKARKNLLRMESISQINDLSDDIQTIFSGRASYDKLTIRYLKRMGVIKKDHNPFGETFAVYPVNSASEFAISYENLGRSDCVYFATYRWSNAEDVFVNGRKISARNSRLSSDEENTESRISLADVTTECIEQPINTFTLYFQ
ncbi:MAG: type II secretion system protein [Alphaproteobacteria bacterium]